MKVWRFVGVILNADLDTLRLRKLFLCRIGNDCICNDNTSGHYHAKCSEGSAIFKISN